jgi:hypothetical protein
MKKLAPFLLLSFLLVACSKTGPGSISQGERMQNPFFAERYYDELTEEMVNLQLQDKTVTSDPRMLTIVDETRRDALAKAQEQTKKKREGRFGGFLTATQQTQGWALLLKGTLYLSTDFTSLPGPSLHLYLSEVMDPRDASFPEKTSVDLGLLESPYGAQQYALPSAAATNVKLRTVVLYDTKLKRIYSFVQL